MQSSSESIQTYEGKAARMSAAEKLAHAILLKSPDYEIARGCAGGMTRNEAAGMMAGFDERERAVFERKYLGSSRSSINMICEATWLLHYHRGRVSVSPDMHRRMVHLALQELADGKLSAAACAKTLGISRHSFAKLTSHYQRIGGYLSDVDAGIEHKAARQIR